MDLSKKEIEVILKLRDEASQKINNFRSNIKELNSATKDTLQPLLLMRQTWMKTGLAVGFVVSAVLKGIQELDKMNKEISRLDYSSIKLGVTTEALSKKMYGFNIASANARIGASIGSSLLENLSYAGKFYGTKAAEAIGATKKFNRASGLYGSMTVGRENSFDDKQKLELWRRANEIAENQLLANEEARKGRSEEAEKANIDLFQKTRQLDTAAFQYKKDLLNEEVAIFRNTGADKIKIQEYYTAAAKRMDEDRTIALQGQEAVRLKAEGRTLDVLRIEQAAALVEFKRQFGSDGAMVKAFIAGQEAIKKNAELNYYNLKSDFQIWHDGMTSIIGSLQTTFGGFYDVTTGQFRSLGDIATDFGRTIISTINQMVAQFVIAKAIMGIGSLFSGGGVQGGVGGSMTATGNQSIAGHSFSTAWTPSAAQLHMMAEGGEGIVRKPTLFLAGEAGPEKYKFTPVSKMSNKESVENSVNQYITYNIVAMDAVSFAEYCRRNPEGIIDVSKAVAMDDIRRRGPVTRQRRG